MGKIRERRIKKKIRNHHQFRKLEQNWNFGAVDLLQKIILSVCVIFGILF